MTIMKLEDICTIMNGHSFRGKINEVTSGNAKVVQLSDIDELEGIDYEKLIRTDFDSKKNDAFLREGDILCVSKGPRLYSIYLNEVPREILATFHVMIIRVRNSQVIPAYLSWVLNNSQKFFQQNSQGSLVTHMSKKMLAEMPIELPDIEIQKQVIELEVLKKRERKILQRIGEKRDVFTLACQNNIINRKFRRNT